MWAGGACERAQLARAQPQKSRWQQGRLPRRPQLCCRRAAPPAGALPPLGLARASRSRPPSPEHHGCAPPARSWHAATLLLGVPKLFPSWEAALADPACKAPPGMAWSDASAPCGTGAPGTGWRGVTCSADGQVTEM